jgi:hypothetical protein
MAPDALLGLFDEPAAETETSERLVGGELPQGARARVRSVVDPANRDRDAVRRADREILDIACEDSLERSGDVFEVRLAAGPPHVADVIQCEIVDDQMFGWREGSVGTRMAELLERKLARRPAVACAPTGCA